jgi:HSP20 family protein
MSPRDNPFDEMDRMVDQMRRSMWGLQHGGETNWGRRGDAGWDRQRSNLNLETDDDGYVLYADVPGFEKSDIDLRFEDGTLTIEATHAYEDDSSSRSRRIYEEVHVPGEVMEDEITASYRNGVLEVHLPTMEAAEDDDSTSIDIE